MQYEYIKFKFNWFHPTCSKRLKSNIMWLNFNGFHKELKTLLKIVFPNKPEWINQDHMYWEFLILFFTFTLSMPGILHGKSRKFYLYSYWLHYIDMRTIFIYCLIFIIAYSKDTASQDLFKLTNLIGVIPKSDSCTLFEHWKPWIISIAGYNMEARFFRGRTVPRENHNLMQENLESC